MELHQLRYFAAVAELGSFTRAAARCHVSQPSLSQQIIKLERQLGQPLLERLGRRVQLTPAGSALYGRAVAILAAVDEAKVAVQTHHDWSAAAVSVGAILTVAPYLVPDLVRGFLHQFPRAQVRVREGFTEQIVQDCLAGELDVGLVALPVADPRLVVQPLLSEELLLALPSGHPLARRRRITLEHISGERFVLLDEVHCLGRQIVSFCREHECQPVVACRSGQMLTVLEMVELGQGISLVPQMSVRRDRSRHRVYRSLGSRAARRTIAMIWHKDRLRGRLVQALVATLRQTVDAGVETAGTGSDSPGAGTSDQFAGGDGRRERTGVKVGQS